LALMLACTSAASQGGAAAAHGGTSLGAPRPSILIQSRRVFAGVTPPSPGGCGCYEPAQFEAAYGLSSLYASNDTGTGQTIVIVDSFGSEEIQSDLATFDAGFDLPAPPSFKIIAPEGAITESNSEWATETSLDVEYAHAIAPGADILLVETPVAETEGAVGFKQIVAAENYVINHQSKLGITGGVVISQSFTAGEQTFGKHFAKKIAPFRTAFRAAEAARVTVLAASGDTGVSGCANAACSPSTTPVDYACRFVALKRSARDQCRRVIAVDQ
jgi:subtilase family serine protease